jgi:hypothetical protein
MHFESSPGNLRAFCAVCGSNAPAYASARTSMYIPEGLLDGDPGVRRAHGGKPLR